MNIEEINKKKYAQYILLRYTKFGCVRLPERNGLNYRNGLPEWTFICGFECL